LASWLGIEARSGSKNNMIAPCLILETLMLGVFCRPRSGVKILNLFFEAGLIRDVPDHRHLGREGA